MSSLQLFVALFGLAIIVVFGQIPEPEFEFANPPSLPKKGAFLFVSMHA